MLNADLVDARSGYIVSWFSYECYASLRGEMPTPAEAPKEEEKEVAPVVPSSVEVTSQTGSTTSSQSEDVQMGVLTQEQLSQLDEDNQPGAKSKSASRGPSRAGSVKSTNSKTSVFESKANKAKEEEQLQFLQDNNTGIDIMKMLPETAQILEVQSILRIDKATRDRVLQGLSLNFF